MILGEMGLCACYELGLDMSIKAILFIFMMAETMHLLDVMKYVFMKA